MNVRRRGRIVIAGVLVALLVTVASPAAAVNGGSFEQAARLYASDPENAACYGDAVDIDGDTAVVGAPWKGPNQRGAVYVYTRTAAGWALQAKLTAPAPADYECFGCSVGISGNVLVVGAEGHSAGPGLGMAGRIYVFRRVGDTWQAPLIIDPPHPHANDRFGAAVAIDGETFIAGMPGMDDAMGDDHGIAYTFVPGAGIWVLQGWVYDSSPAPYAQLGSSVAISGNTAVAGCPGEGASTGSVCVATRTGTTWTTGPKVTSSWSVANDWFGSDVAIAGNTMVIGAQGRDTPYGTNAGAAYVFVNPGSGWAQQSYLTAPTGANYRSFGSGVAVEGDTVVIGERQDTARGAAYIYRRSGSTWSRVQTIDMSAVTPAVQMFGCDAAISRGTAIIGSYLADSSAISDAGGAFIYSHLVPVYRFYNAGFGTHFYTPSATERDMVIATWPHIYNYEGVAYKVNPENNGQPLYRFYKPSSASHFYTASVAEKNHVIATWPHIYTYEGQTYAVTPAPSAGLPIYRFYNVLNGSHFYTVSAAEKAHVQATWPHIYTYEGIAFWLGQ